MRILQNQDRAPKRGRHPQAAAERDGSRINPSVRGSVQRACGMGLPSAQSIATQTACLQPTHVLPHASHPLQVSVTPNMMQMPREHLLSHIAQGTIAASARSLQLHLLFKSFQRWPAESRNVGPYLQSAVFPATFPTVYHGSPKSASFYETLSLTISFGFASLSL